MKSVETEEEAARFLISHGDDIVNILGAEINNIEATIKASAFLSSEGITVLEYHCNPILTFFMGQRKVYVITVIIKSCFDNI